MFRLIFKKTFRELLVHAKFIYITCCYDGIVVACRSLFVMGSDVVITLLLALLCLRKKLKIPFLCLLKISVHQALDKRDHVWLWKTTYVHFTIYRTKTQILYTTSFQSGFKFWETGNSLLEVSMENRVDGAQQMSDVLPDNCGWGTTRKPAHCARCNIQVWFSHNSGLFLRTASLKCSKTSWYNCLFTIWPRGTNSWWTMPF